MKICIRDLTVFNEKWINLPTNLDEIINPDHEYIIVDHDYTMQPSEFSNIEELNDFLYDCEHMYFVDDTTLEILSKTYTYEEVMACVKNESFTIIDFNEHTKDWYAGNGANYSNDSDLGLCMFDSGYIDLPFEYKPEMEDYIRWEYIWTDAQCRGWRKVISSNNCYLINNVW